MSYPITMATRARELKAAGWQHREIQRLVHRETGRKPSLNTIQRWVDPAYAKRHNERRLGEHRAHSARGARTGARLGSHRHTPEFKVARIRALALLGVSQRAIADVMNFDFGDALTEGQIRTVLNTGRFPKRRRAEISA